MGQGETEGGTGEEIRRGGGGGLEQLRRKGWQEGGGHVTGAGEGGIRTDENNRLTWSKIRLRCRSLAHAAPGACNTKKTLEQHNKGRQVVKGGELTWRGGLKSRSKR